MLDEFLIIEEDKENGGYTIREANINEGGGHYEKKQIAKMYLEQLENSNQFDELCSKL
jgi:hypothetical protein